MFMSQIMKENSVFILLLTVFFLSTVTLQRHSHAQTFQFLNPANLPPNIAAYELEKRLMATNPYYNFDEALYGNAPVFAEDTRLKDACFKGAAQQNLAAPNLQDKSTLTTDINVVAGAQPTNCMPTKITERFSPLQLNPWYLTSILNETGIREPYQGFAYKGGGGNNVIFNSQRMIMPTESMQVGCANALMVNNAGGATNPLDPVWMRRELDNCTNQYILQQARFIRDPDDNQADYFGISSGVCQPFRLEMPPTRYDLYEYVPSEYIGVAWVKLLMDDSYQYRGGRSAAEPNYNRDTRVDVVRQIPIPSERFGMILIEDLVEETPVNLQFEKILDPSHPYSPRWDFEVDDRSYSPLTAVYGSNPLEGVRCSDEVPVDLLSFRKHMFERWVPQKISWNIACFLTWPCNPFVWTYLLQCNGDTPCCSTRWNVADRWETVFGEGVARAVCGVPMREVCNFMSRPLTGLNTLKLRQTTSDNFPQGVPEGYSFREYFGDHKPYMRCWDTNTECGETEQTFTQSIQGAGSYDFVSNVNSTLGSEYALMGAGREGESCTIGGGLGQGGVANPDPISSWSELKLYYTRSIRQGAKCIPMHTKMFKPDEGEDMILAATGAEWQERSVDDTGLESRYIPRKWTYGWRGFVSDPTLSQRFPNLGGTASIDVGLDQATKGDILIFDQDVVMQGGAGTWRNPYVAYVKDVVNERSRATILNPAIAATLNPEMDNIKISAFNHGKYVDACGNTDEMGMALDVTLYKSALPPPYPDILSTLGTHTETCDDPRLSSCIEPYWNTVKRYFIGEDTK
jgi:hypothetical protein